MYCTERGDVKLLTYFIIYMTLYKNVDTAAVVYLGVAVFCVCVRVCARKRFMFYTCLKHISQSHFYYVFQVTQIFILQGGMAEHHSNDIIKLGYLRRRV